MASKIKTAVPHEPNTRRAATHGVLIDTLGSKSPQPTDKDRRGVDRGFMSAGNSMQALANATSEGDIVSPHADSTSEKRMTNNAAVMPRDFALAASSVR